MKLLTVPLYTHSTAPHPSRTFLHHYSQQQIGKLIMSTHASQRVTRTQEDNLEVMVRFSAGISCRTQAGSRQQQSPRGSLWSERCSGLWALERARQEVPPQGSSTFCSGSAYANCSLTTSLSSAPGSHPGLICPMRSKTSAWEATS